MQPILVRHYRPLCHESKQDQWLERMADVAKRMRDEAEDSKPK